MELNNLQNRRDVLGLISRRGILKSAATLAAASSTLVRGQDGAILAYIGCYTPNGEGIYLFSMNPFDGTLTQMNVFTGPGTSNPSWLALHPNKKYLYAVNENSPGTVSAFSVGPNGSLTFLNTVSAQGNGPAHMSIDASGQYALIANYGSGNVAVIRLLANGALGAATDVKSDISACSPAAMRSKLTATRVTRPPVQPPTTPHNSVSAPRLVQSRPLQVVLASN